MPLYEFKCLKCNEFIEILVMRQEEQIEMKCPKCDSPELERVLSTTSYSMSGGGDQSGVSVSNAQTRTCSGGSCTTYDIPGPK
jgi:putative FmdB family regulatory protein